MSNEHLTLVNESGNIEEKINEVISPLSEKISGNDLIDALDVDSYRGQLSDVSRIEVSVKRACFFSEDGKLLFISPHLNTLGENNNPAKYIESTDYVLGRCGVSKLLRNAVVNSLSYRVSFYILTRREKDIEIIGSLLRESLGSAGNEWHGMIHI